MWETLSTQEFTAFLADVYGLYADVGIEEKFSSNPINGRVKIFPNLDLSDISREQLSEGKRDRFEVSWGIAFPVLKHKFRASGILQILPIDSGRCLLILKGSVHIRFFGVGSLLERKVVKRLKREGEQFHRVIVRWKAMNTQS